MNFNDDDDDDGDYDIFKPNIVLFTLSVSFFNCSVDFQNAILKKDFCESTFQGLMMTLSVITSFSRVLRHRVTRLSL